jgi:crotonobetainyl-CoA:carnitine CoA-transferase CaiB-like acyl-CoA transferase
VGGLYDPLRSGDGPLAGIRVVDVTRARAGPTCVRQLADLGADVIQVANPHKGDIGGSDAWNLHRGKRSILVDITREDGRAVLLRLVDRADVFVENFRPGVKHRLRIDPDTLLARNPRLVYASISGFGQDGPYAERPGVDQIAQGMGGLMSVTGPPGSGPWRTGIAVSDTVAGTFLAQGVLAALVARGRTGRGQWVHTSLLETMVNLMDFQAARWLNEGERPVQEGNGHPTFFGMGAYPTADGWVNVAVMGTWDAFCTALDAPELASDPRFATDGDRRAHRDELEEEVARRTATRPTVEWVERFTAADMPTGPVYRVDEVFDDAQVHELALTRTVPRPDGGSVEVLRTPLTFSETPAAVRSGPPRPGAHGREILAELGCSDDEVDALRASGAVAWEQASRGWPAR